MKASSATAVLFVDRVEPTRDFFLKAGFSVMFDVPDGDRLGFAGMAKDGAIVMVETRGNADELTCEEPSGNLVTFAKIDRS